MNRQRKREDIERGARLQFARKEAGYETAADAAADLDMEYATYNNHETGWRGITRKTARCYAEKFGVNIDWLHENIGMMRGQASKVPPDLLAGLSPAARQEALDFIDYLKTKHGI